MCWPPRRWTQPIAPLRRGRPGSPAATIAPHVRTVRRQPASSWPAALMSEADSSMQVELDSGKRVKVKTANVLLRFDAPQPAELIARAQTLAQEIDLDLAWEFAPEAEFGFADLARDYFERRGRHRQAGRGAVPAVRGAALLSPPGQGHVQEGAGRHRQGGAAGHRAQEAAGRCRSSTGRRSSWPAFARRRSASSSTASCSSPTRTAPNTRPWSRPRGARSARRSIC